MKSIIYIVFLGILFSCTASKHLNPTNENVVHKLKDNQTFELTEIATDASYGLSEKNPIQVGGFSEGPLNERRYLNALAGPNGETISYFRAGSCCHVKSKNDPFGSGKVPLDRYRVTWKGANDTLSIYINMYDKGVLKAPVGFTIKK